MKENNPVALPHGSERAQPDLVMCITMRQHVHTEEISSLLCCITTPPAVPNEGPEPPPKPGTELEAQRAGAAVPAPKPGTEPEAPNAGAAELASKTGALPEAP